jgi:hypothetical protein
MPTGLLWALMFRPRTAAAVAAMIRVGHAGLIKRAIAVSIALTARWSRLVRVTSVVRTPLATAIITSILARPAATAVVTSELTRLLPAAAASTRAITTRARVTGRPTATTAAASATVTTAAPMPTTAAVTAATAGIPPASTAAAAPLRLRTPLGRAVPRRARRRCNNFKLWQRRHRQHPFEHPLNVLEQWSLVWRDERHRTAGSTSTCRAANTVHVVFGDVRQLVIHNMRQLFDIESARGDLGSNEGRDLVRLEISQRPHARALALVAMDGRRTDAGGLELLREPVGAVLGARKHQHLVPVAIANQMRKQMPLVIFRDAVHLLVNPLRSCIPGGHFDADRVTQNPARELADIIRIRRGEHQVLTLRR